MQQSVHAGRQAPKLYFAYTHNMFSLFRASLRSDASPMVRSSLTAYGLLFVFSGLAIFIAPELLAYFVGGLLIFIGVTLLTMRSRMK